MHANKAKSQAEIYVRDINSLKKARQYENRILMS